VTWSFLFLACLLLGLVLAATFAVLQRNRVHQVCHQIIVPVPEHHSALINWIARRASFPLAAFGILGLVLRRSETGTRFAGALTAALVAGLIAMVVFREWRETPPPARAVVVREIPVSGFGQVEIEQGGRKFVLAAKSADGQPIPVGSAIEMVDCESSVLTVRLLAAAVPAA